MLVSQLGNAEILHASGNVKSLCVDTHWGRGRASGEDLCVVADLEECAAIDGSPD